MSNLIRVNFVQVEEHDGQPTVSSLQVAERFGKQHKNVLQSIENLECSQEFRRLNFQPSNYLNSQGKEMPMFYLTRDGFSFLAMGFTGKEAAYWKEQFIAAFNAMENQLTQNFAFANKIDLFVSQLQEWSRDLREAIIDNKTEITVVKDDVGQLKNDVAGMKTQINDVTNYIYSKRQNITQRVKEQHVLAVHRFFKGYCPHCQENKVLDDKGKVLPGSEFDHFHNRAWRNLEHTWLICGKCHDAFSFNRIGRTGDAHVMFSSYQVKVRKMFGTNPKQKPQGLPGVNLGGQQ